MFKRIRNIFQLQNMYTFIAIIIFGIILDKLKVPYLKEIAPAFIPLIFIPYFYKELKAKKMETKKSIKFIAIIYALLIILLIDINIFGMPTLDFLPKYLDNILLYSIVFNILNLSLYKAKNIRKHHFIFNAALIYFLTLLIPVINRR